MMICCSGDSTRCPQEVRDGDFSNQSKSNTGLSDIFFMKKETLKIGFLCCLFVKTNFIPNSIVRFNKPLPKILDGTSSSCLPFVKSGRKGYLDGTGCSQDPRLTFVRSQFDHSS